MEFSFILLILFTFLTIILVTTLFSNNDTTASASSSGSAASKADHSGEEGSLAQSVREEVKAGLVKTGPSVNLTEQQGTVAGLTSTNKPEEDSQRRFVGKITDPVAADRRTVGEEGLHAAEVRIHDATNEGNMKSGIMTGGATESPEDSNYMEEVDAEHAPMKYAPRTSQMKKMITKEELEEEQRVQQEQLAAIFQLLKENQETFGEVSEGDVEEQLRLYSI
ncbi:matrix-remodeling-associated protein 7 isoform X5 [Coregonus clupeaformis]|uniref:matrix-remodeling-associated protein 7 isoform X5 n=1 Tax=Coregonus clupeaformis TaxID=59861 RepID=UPI001BDF96D0|nr:matrix-remodeling-associated protein 7 isoform X5 [Coregonus clupeaformis]